jgi:acid phosphatase family membrane protein YuiD
VSDLLSNRVLLVPLGVWLLSQSLKVVTGVLLERRLDLRLILAAGGMPSSHSALVASLTTAIGHESGLGSPLFGAAVVLAAIVMYDAAGVRRTVGTHARVLNLLLDDLMVRHQIDEKRLRELVGHTPLQVVVGAVVGVAATMLWFSLV